MTCLVFDLDGTLTDTLEDLWRSTCAALEACNMPLRSIDEVRQFVGNGVHRLIERAVPQGTSDEGVERCFQAFREHYIVHCQDHTHLYPGVPELLAELRSRGVPMAVVSNKLQAGVTELEQRLFPGIFQVALGEREGVPRKPAPDMVQLALSEMGVSASDAIYIGDSEVDIATARNAGLPCVSVLWGFRDRDFLLQHGATTLIEQPRQLLDFFFPQSII